VGTVLHSASILDINTFTVSSMIRHIQDFTASSQSIAVSLVHLWNCLSACPVEYRGGGGVVIPVDILINGPYLSNLIIVINFLSKRVKYVYIYIYNYNTFIG
jgi:hypothetical protein